MSSIIPGYEYDIFISYRRKDNKGDRWVSEFVDALKTELESTFKEEISVYFDINPHDGLLETHNVDASLKEKLKCLIFIPIISQTYCDPNSYAWQHEFCAFNQLAKDDQSGRDIKLSSGNVASRILPIKIHDLDQADKTLLENELGSVLRSVDFIYKSSGVNRPLKPDDSRAENLNHTYYRDQINKVANAVKEIITSLKFQDAGQNDLIVRKMDSKSNSVYKRSKKLNLKIAFWFCLVLVLAVTGYLLLPVLTKTTPDVVDKSIAVLPFENLSNDPDQDYFGDGIMQEILNHLFKIGGLKIPSSTSSMRYKGSKLSVKEIAGELNVSYVLEGNVSRSGDNVRIIVRMINGKDERLIWTEDYNKLMTAPNLLEIQREVAQQVAVNMNVVINPEVKKRIEAKSTSNTEAYTLFLQAMTQHLPFEQAEPKLERAIFLDPDYADAYALLAFYWLYHRGGFAGKLERKQVLEKAEPLLEKSLQLDKNSIIAHTTLAALSLFYKWDFNSVEKEYQIMNQLNPSNSDYYTIRIFRDYLLAVGKPHEAFKLVQNAFNLNINSSDLWRSMALTYYYDSQPEKAMETIETARKRYPDDPSMLVISIILFNYEAKFDKTITLFEKSTILEKNITKLIPLHLGNMGIAYYKTGEKTKSEAYLNELLARSKNSAVGSPSFFAAAIYTAMGENDKAIQSLEKAYANHEVEMFFLKMEPLFATLHGDPRFEKILTNIGFK